MWAVRAVALFVGGGDLLDGNQLSVARTAIAHAGGVDFRRLTPTEGQGATPVRRPRTVIVTRRRFWFRGQNRRRPLPAFAARPNVEDIFAKIRPEPLKASLALKGLEPNPTAEAPETL